MLLVSGKLSRAVFRARTGALRRSAAGYSLYDMMVTLSVASVVTTGASGLVDIIDDHRKTAYTNELVGILHLARSESVKRGRDAVLCPSRNSRQCDAHSGEYTAWHDGLMLYIDENDNGLYDPGETIVRVFKPGSGLTVKSSSHRPKVTYRPNGMSGGSTITLTVCGASAASKARYIVLANTGRARLSDKPGDGKADAPHETCGNKNKKG